MESHRARFVTSTIGTLALVVTGIFAREMPAHADPAYTVDEITASFARDIARVKFVKLGARVDHCFPGGSGVPETT